MTIPEHIMMGVAVIVNRQGHQIFTRQQINNELEVEDHQWKYSYYPIFQGMRDDHPGHAPDVGERYEGIFHRVAHGEYRLTDKGRALLEELDQ